MVDAAVAEILEMVGPIPDALDPSWTRVDFRPILAGNIERTMPTVLRRDDGEHLFYERRVNGLHADSGIGKSMLCAFGAAQELNAGHHVAWVDFEDPDSSAIVERLRMFDVDDDTIAERLHYYAPREPFSDAAVAALVCAITEHGITKVVVDSVGEAFGLEGIDENKDVEVAPWLRRVARVLADAGPAVELVDHSTKAADNPLHPSGSKRKRAAITGASYLVEAVRPLTREDGGTLRLICAKDRYGNYRRGDIVATFEVTAYRDGGSTAHLWPPLDGDSDSDEARLLVVARAAVRAAKKAGETLTQRRLLARMNVKASATLKRAGIEEAVARGALRSESGPNRSILHAYVRDLETSPEDTTQ